MPSSGVDVYIDENSGTGTMTTNAMLYTGSFTMTNGAGTCNITVTNSNGITPNLAGATVTLLAGKYTAGGTFDIRTNVTFYTNGNTIGSLSTNGGVGGTLTLGDAMIVSGAIALNANTKTIVTGGNNLTAGSIAVTGGTFDSTITLTGTTGTLWTAGSGTFTMTSSTIVMTAAALTGNVTFTGNSKTYNTVTLLGGNTYSTIITGANTFATLNLNSTGTGNATFSVTASNTNTISTALNTNFSTNDLWGTIVSATAGTATTFALSGATVTTTYTSFRDVTFTGTPTQSNSNSADAGGCTGVTFSNQDRYWVGGTANYDSTSGSKWATTSGGTDYQIYPIIGNDVYFDGTSDGDGSVVVTLTANRAVKSINFTGYTGTFIHNGSVTLNVYGSATWVSGMTYTLGSASTSALNFAATSSGKTFTSGTKTFGNITFAGVGGAWTLQDGLTANSVTLTNGSLTTGAFTHAWVYFSSNNSNTRTMNITGSTITISGGGGSNQFWDFGTTTSNLTFTSTSSTINMTGNGMYLYTGGQTYNIFNMTGSNSGIVYGDATFSTLNYSRSGGGYTFYLGGNVNIANSGTFTLAGGADNRYRVLCASTVLGTTRTITLGTSVTLNFTRADFQDITGAGSTSWDISAITGLSGDCLGNSGITFTTRQDNYWYQDTGNYYDDAKWKLADHSTAGRSPLPQDDAYFDSSSFTAGSKTVSTVTPRACRNMIWTGATSTPTFTPGGDFYIFGSLTFISGMTYTTSTRILYLYGRSANHTIDSGGKAISTVYVNSYGGTYTQPTALTASYFTLANGTYTLGANLTPSVFAQTGGTFNAVSYNVTMAGIASQTTFGQSGGTLNLGSGTWDSAYSQASSGGTAFNRSGGTFNPDTSTFKFSGSSTGGYTIWQTNVATTFNNLWVSGSYTGAGGYHSMRGSSGITVNGTWTIAAGNIFKTQNTASYTLGASANLVWTGSVGSTIKWSPASGTVVITRPSGTQIFSCDYLDLTNFPATEANTFYAGANSTNGGSNGNWIFTAPPGGGKGFFALKRR